MRIKGLECIIPELKISNDEILELVEYHSRKTFSGDIKNLLKSIDAKFDTSGIHSRFWRKRKEKPILMIENAFESALRKSEIGIKDIDTLIYVGIDRGFLEPANACFIAKKLGLTTIKTFDIVDACMGWTTALYLSRSLLACGESQNICIVSSECPMDDGGAIFPRNFKVNNIHELDWKFPSFTIGEAVSITIIGSSDYNPIFKFKSNYNHADLCVIPLHKYSDYSSESKYLNKTNPIEFSAYGRELYINGYKDALDVLKEVLHEIDYIPKLIIPHSVSKRVPVRVGEILNMQEKMYTTFPHLGNLATSSIPASINEALFYNKLNQGDKFIGWMASSGLKYCAFEIQV